MSRSTPSTPFLQDPKAEVIGEKGYAVEPEMEKHTVESNESSVLASSTADSVEEPEILEDDGASTEEKGVDKPQPPVEYPKGIEMFFIMLALVVSIILCSLDQVSSPPSKTLHCYLSTMDPIPER